MGTGMDPAARTWPISRPLLTPRSPPFARHPCAPNLYRSPHVAAVYWSLYRLARVGSPPLTKRADWQFYLKQAVRVPSDWSYPLHGNSYSTTDCCAHLPMPEIPNLDLQPCA
jgi:hypothetical protein